MLDQEHGDWSSYMYALRAPDSMHGPYSMCGETPKLHTGFGADNDTKLSGTELGTQKIQHTIQIKMTSNS